MIHKAADAIKQVLLGVVPLAVLVICSPTEKANAQFMSVFSALTATVNAIGGSITGIDQVVQGMNQLRTTVVSPVADLQRLQANGISMVNAYRNAMNGIYSAPVVSGQTSAVANLESGMFLQSPLTSSTASSYNLGPQFAAVFGARPSTTQVSAATALSVDMTDAAAQDAMEQATFGDSTAQTTINQGQTLENQALATSSGSAPQLEAEALTYAVQSLAHEHMMYAAELRTLAMQIGAKGVVIKQEGAIVQSEGSALQGILGVR